MTTSPPADNPEVGPDAAALLERLRGDTRVRRDVTALRTAFADAFPEYRTEGDKDERLARLLEELEGAGELQRSRRRSGPILPASVQMRRLARSSRRIPARSLPVLHSALRAARTELRGYTADEVTVLERLSRFLQEHPDAPEIARRERSFQLFRDERRLDALRKTRFGRLGLVDDDLLRCADTPLPFPWVRVGRRRDARMLIVENSATFDSLAVVLEQHSDPPYDIVVWGGGETIEKRLPFTRRLPEHAGIDAIEQIFYFGDLDPPGVRIAAQTARIASALELPPVRPAVELYRALLDTGAAPYSSAYRAYAPGELAWLPTDVAESARRLHARGLRVPQEALDRAQLPQALRAATPHPA